jgi:uncharacterized protein YutE (UPF0331/DUF86 family)
MDRYYWLFSSSSQSIAAFVAFLLTGYALVLNLLENVQRNDPTLSEIHDSLKDKYFHRLKWVSIITGASIMFNLLCILLNGFTDKFIPYVMGFTFLITLLSIILGLYFVITIINPNRYKIAAKKLLKDYSKEEESIDEGEFFKEFVKLESKIRDILISKQFYIQNGKNLRMDFSMRQMINALYENELITRYFYEKLLKLNKYRNLIFHGHETKVYQSVMDDIKDLNNYLDNLRTINNAP